MMLILLLSFRQTNIEDLLILALLKLAPISIAPRGYLLHCDCECYLNWFCSSILLRRSLSNVQYFSNSLQRFLIDKGFSLARCPTKGPMRRPFMTALVATFSSTLGALVLECTNLKWYCLTDSLCYCLHWKKSEALAIHLRNLENLPLFCAGFSPMTTQIQALASSTMREHLLPRQ